MISSKLFLGGVVLLVGVFLRGTFSTRLSVSSLDENKKAVIVEFRAMVEKDLPHPYMKSDAYLLRSLSANDFKLKESMDYLKKNLAWREVQKVDTILDEDWSDFRQRFPYDVNSVNKEGRPVLYYHYGIWDISQEASSGDYKRLVRYMTANMMEHADSKVRSNDDISQFDIIIDMEGYSLEKHGCVQCLQLARELLKNAEAGYSGAADNVFIINAPVIFENVYPMISRAFLEEKSRDSTKVLGGRETYEPILLQHIAKEQFPKGMA